MTSFIRKAIPGILAQIGEAAMIVTTLLMMSLTRSSVVYSEAVRWFPGDYYDSRARVEFQRQVMESWPGPSQLLRLWQEGGLDEPDRVSLLLGGAAFHDPVLLPAYHEAVTSPSLRLRQAAVYGYRDLLADSLPDVCGGVSDEDAALLAEEIGWFRWTLRRKTLVEMWLQALLAHEKLGLPGWRGVALQRPPNVCLRAVERLVDVEDLDLLLQAYDTSQDFGTRVSLLELVEAISLSRFIIMPERSNEGWGRHVFTTAMDGLQGARRQWSAAGCSVDGDEVLVRNLEVMGVTGINTRGEEGCQVWLNVLERGFPRWWMLAAHRLYACGGPWFEMSALSPDSPRDRDHRAQLLKWFKPLRPNAQGSKARH
jgi:hypothetical protein